MYNSIQHFLDFGAGKIEKKVRNFINEQKDLADLVIGLQEELFELGRNIVREVLEDMDETLRQSGLRKKRWEIVRKDNSELLTTFGPMVFNRTYFKPKDGGKREYLVDRLVGINPHDRMSADVVINALEEASESSYRKGGEKAAYIDEISKQTVKEKIHELEIVQPEVVKTKREVRVLFIEADEDHVSSQLKNDTYKGKNIFMPKLAYVHEGIDYESDSMKRCVLKNVRYFGGLQKGEDLWLEIAQYIEEVYDTEKVEIIYISGDGASWIKQGLNWIPKSKFVLDKYHMNKYVKEATAHLNDEAIVQGLRDALDEGDMELMEKVFNRILDLTEVKTKRHAVHVAKRYLLNNWAGIKIKVDNQEIVGCSAEGHVSHVLSNRLSSRPMGWSEKGVHNMAQLQIYKKNGGKIYDLVMARKKKEQRSQKQAIQDQLIRELKTKGKRNDNVWNSNVTVIKKGHKTSLYKGLRNIMGI